MARSRLYDFNAAYAQRHGRPPRPREVDDIRKKIDLVLGRTQGNAILELDLEAEPRTGESYRVIAAGDSITIRAGRSFFELVFTKVDGQGRLECMAFRNGGYDETHLIAEGETEAVWGGMLMDATLFKVTATRIHYTEGAFGKLAALEVAVKLDRYVPWPY